MRVRLKHKRLAAELAKSRLSQNRWAQKLGLDSGHLSQLVNGRRVHPNARTRRKLLKGLDLDFDALFEVELPPRPGAIGRRFGADNDYPRQLRSRSSQWRSTRGGRLMMGLFHDLAIALRTLSKSPVFSLIVIVTLALGIGANTAIFSVVDSVLLEPLPYASPDRLVRVWTSSAERPRHGNTSHDDLRDWAARSKTFEALGGYPSVSISGPVMTGDGPPRQLAASFVTEDFFDVLGVEAALGRRLLEEDQIEGKNRVLVLSDACWRRRFGSDPDIVGRDVTLNNAVSRVIGVMPADFQYPSADIELWTPISLIPDTGVPRKRFVRWLNIVGRLKPGVSLKQAGSDLSSIALGLSEEYPEANEGVTAVALQPLRENMVGDVATHMWVTLGAVAFVLLIGCANVANLMLARSNRLRRDLSIRLALGAGRWRVLRQILAESVLLSLIGGVVGVAVAFLGIRFLVSMAPSGIPRLSSVDIDPSVLLFAAVASIATGIAFGLFPAWRSTRTDLQEALKEGGRSPDISRGEGWYRQTLVVAQLGLVVLLTIGSGLLMSSYGALRSVDPGFQPEGVLTMQVNAPNYRLPDSPAIIAYFENLLKGIRSMPGVTHAAVIRPMPLGPDTFSGESWRLYHAGRPQTPENEVHVKTSFVSADFFRSMAIPILEGEDFPPSEPGTRQTWVGIINRAAAERYFPDQAVRVGQRLALGQKEMEVIGVVGNIHQTDLRDEPEPALYWPMHQGPRVGMTLVIRSSGDPVSLVGPIQSRIWETSPDQPINNVATVDQLLTRSLSQQRFSMVLLASFAGLALLMAMVGIYGVLSYTVGRRVPEIGIRITLGARVADVLRMVVLQGMTPALIGIVVGTVGAVGLTRFMSSLLFGINARDPLVFGFAIGLLLAIALVACLIPARRATRVDPMTALRYE